MATFNQQNQVVQTQYNAEVINFGAVATPEDFLKQLKVLQTELNKAIEAETVTGEDAINAESHLKKTILQAESKNPEKSSIIKNLNQAKELVNGATNLTTAISKAVEVAGNLF